MTDKQERFIQCLEMALAYMLLDNKKKLAKKLDYIINLFRSDQSVLAMLECENLGINDKTLCDIRNIFGLSKWR